VIARQAEELRRAFDRSFAEPPGEELARLEDLLAIRIGGDPFAIRLRDVGGLFADKAITAMPSPLAELVGVAGFRGGVVPVYDLRALLGYPASEPTRWLVLVTPIALAFDHFEGHLRVAPDAIAPAPPSERPGHVREVVRVTDGTRPLVHVGSLLEAIKKRIPQRER
jgi:chemotaxis signal transduction protein